MTLGKPVIFNRLLAPTFNKKAAVGPRLHASWDWLSASQDWALLMKHFTPRFFSFAHSLFASDWVSNPTRRTR